MAVGRYTSPDRMVSVINRGLMDLIGAARPSIADPFLPAKIRDGRLEDIRECIGCNMCILSNGLGVPLRCTQNPTMGEEWRRGWHPEIIAGASSGEAVLVVGAGPAGLEAALAAGRRGYMVALAEATGELGGRACREATLAGLSTWSRVRDWRLGQIDKLAHVEIYRSSRLNAEQVLEFGFGHVCIATGSIWRRDGRGRSSFSPFEGHDLDGVITPDDVMAAASIDGPVLVYDDDHFYMGGVIAETLAGRGLDVVIATSAGIVSPLCAHTLEQERIEARLIEMGVVIRTSRLMVSFDGSEAVLAHASGSKDVVIPCRTVVVVTSRQPAEGLWKAIMARKEEHADAGLKSVRRIGDCEAPQTIAAAVHAGHLYARTLDTADHVKRDRILVAPDRDMS